MNKEEFKKLLKEVIKSGELEIIPICKVYAYSDNEDRGIQIKLDGKQIMEIGEKDIFEGY